MAAKKPVLVGVLWWPHSGGRWFCRNLVKKHPAVLETVFTHPWIFISTDMTLEQDITAQVHKARSLPDLKKHLRALVQSTDRGREEGLRRYFDAIRKTYLPAKSPRTHIVGEMCMGSPVPRMPDMRALYRACPDLKIIHLVRHPADSFPSFSVRHEFDADPVKAAGSWLTLNAGVRTFYEEHPRHAKNYLMLKYEDVLKNPVAQLKKTARFMGLPYDAAMVSDISTRWGRNTRSATEAAVMKTITRLAGPELRKYGYT